MALPLYQQAHSAKLGNDAHRGLWWSRFFDKYSADFGKPGDGEKGSFIAEICKGRCGDDAQLKKSAERISALAEKLGGEACRFISQGRFVTGMGNDHPTENGFTWHPTLGVPYLPASSVKGLVRGWIEWNGESHEHFRDLKNWFGSQTKSEVSEQAGWFIFFDALPTESVQLAADVMTPHYDKWYEQGGGLNPLASDTVPADWHSPVPVTFLTVKQAHFQFAIAFRGGLEEESRQLAQITLPKVMAVLQDALEWAGAGAKTATGYGRMRIDADDAENRKNALGERLEKDRLDAIEKLGPNLLAIELLRGDIEKLLSRGKISISDAFWGGRIKKLAMQALESAEWSAADKMELASMLEEWAEKLMNINAKELRKQLKLNLLRGG